MVNNEQNYRQKIYNDPKQVKINSALLGTGPGEQAFRAGHYKDLTETGNRARKVSGTQGTMGKNGFKNLTAFLYWERRHGLFIQMDNRQNLGLFFHDCLLTPMGFACIFYSAWVKKEFVKME